MNNNINGQLLLADSTIIDLTNSFTLENRSNIAPGTIIVLDDSVEYLPAPAAATKSSGKLRRNTSTPKKVDEPKAKTKMLARTGSAIGDCPICWEGLGTKPMAATQCGHVFCYPCLEMAVRINQQCPNCRQSLKGKKSYHPLYLSVPL